MSAEYDDAAAIGKRYRRQDEIGTPWALTIDEQTLAAEIGLGLTPVRQALRRLAWDLEGTAVQLIVAPAVSAATSCAEVSIRGGVTSRASGPSMQTRVVSADYHRTLGIPVVRGRTIAASDRTG